MVAVRQASCLWVPWPRRAAGHLGDVTSTRYALFGDLVSRLEDDFAMRCATERDAQDRSEYGRVTVPADATVCGTRIVVCVSKFGSPALVCADNPGAFLVL